MVTLLQRKKIIKLGSNVEFPPRDGKIYDEQGDLIKNFGGYIFVPERTNNSGFDMTIQYLRRRLVVVIMH